jgi:hypothetical protein
MRPIPRTSRWLSTIAVYTTVVTVTACVPPQPIVSPRPFLARADSTEYQRYRAPGQRELAGQAFLTTRGGDVKLAAGRLVTLDPATAYAKEWFGRFGAHLATFADPPADPFFIAARRTTTASADGRFRFTELPAGEYLVRTTVTWETGSSSAGLQGGVVAALITLKENANAEVVLNTVYTPQLAATLGITTVTESELASKPHRVLGTVSGTSCQVGLIDPSPTEGEARQRLVIAAAERSADAVTRVNCRKHGMSFRPNCSSRIICEADAIAWGA